MISSTIFCVDELPNVQRFPHMILNSIFCMDEFPNVPKYAYDDCLTKLTVFGVVRDKWCRWKISRQHLVGVSAARGKGQLVHTFPKDNYKPDIWCRLVPFIWAGVVGVVMVLRFPSDDLKHNTFRGWAPFSPEIPPTQFWTLYFVVAISKTSQQNACEEMKVIEQFQL